MFRFNKEKNASPNLSNSVGHNFLVNGIHIKGTINSNQNIRIDGVLDGDLHCSAKVILGKTGQINGNLSCKQAIVEGKITGTTKVSERLELASTAIINGDIFSTKLIVEDGAEFNGACHMGKQALKAIADEPGGQKNIASIFGKKHKKGQKAG